MATLHKAAQAALDTELGQALRQNGTSAYYVAGSCQLETPVKLYFESQPETAGSVGAPAAEATQHCLQLSGSLLSPHAMKQLLEAAKPSAFGMGTERVTDPTYRSALELLPGTFAISPCQLMPPQEVLADVQQLLMPNAPGISAELCKLNIYAPGGHFKSHVDTPKSEAMFGSLVVCLPSAFEGGQLLLKHKGARYSCEWGKQQQQQQQQQQQEQQQQQQQQQQEQQQEQQAGATAAEGASASAAAAPGAGKGGPALQWVAFYSDVEHSIESVTSGYRITLTYNLMVLPEAAAGARGQKLLHAADVTKTAPLYGALRELLGNAAWHPEGARLGFFLEHKYAARLRALKDSMFPGILKGGDRLLYAAATAVGLQAQVVPVYKAWHNGMTDMEMEEAEEEMSEEQFVKSSVRVGKSFDKEVAELANDAMGDDGADMFVEFLLRRAHGRTKGPQAQPLPPIRWCSRADRDSLYLQDTVLAYGNEPQGTDVLYSAAGLLVTIPAWGLPEREALMGAAEAAAGAAEAGAGGAGGAGA